MAMGVQLPKPSPEQAEQVRIWQMRLAWGGVLLLGIGLVGFPNQPAIGVLGAAAAIGLAAYATKNASWYGPLAGGAHLFALFALLPTLVGGRWCSSGCGQATIWSREAAWLVPVAGIAAHLVAGFGILATSQRGEPNPRAPWWSVPPMAGSIVALMIALQTGFWCRWCVLAHAIMVLVALGYLRTLSWATPLWAAAGLAGLLHAFIPLSSPPPPTDGAALAATVRSAGWSMGGSGHEAVSAYRTTTSATLWGDSSAPQVFVAVLEVGCLACRETWASLRSLSPAVAAKRVAVRVLLLPGADAASRDLVDLVNQAGLLNSELFAQALDQVYRSERPARQVLTDLLASPLGSQLVAQSAALMPLAKDLGTDAITLAAVWKVDRAPRLWLLDAGTSPQGLPALAGPYDPPTLLTTLNRRFPARNSP